MKDWALKSIQALRDSGMTDKTIAVLVGINPGTLCGIMSGKREPPARLDLYMKLNAALATRLSQLELHREKITALGDDFQEKITCPKP